jgi:hypothetical protein
VLLSAEATEKVLLQDVENKRTNNISQKEELVQ